MKYRVHTTNPTSIRRIELDRFTIFLHENNDGDVRFECESINFDGIKLEDGADLPKDAEVWIWAQAGHGEMPFQAGSVGNYEPPTDAWLNELDTSKPLSFRVLAVEPNASKLILASAEDVRAKTDDELSNVKPVLPVEKIDNLGDEVWRLFTGDAERPVLQVNKEFPRIMELLQHDPVFQVLILPNAIRASLKHAAFNNTVGADEQDAWQNDWFQFAKEHGGDEIPLAEDDDAEEKITEWANDIVKIFTSRKQTLSRAVKFMERHYE